MIYGLTLLLGVYCVYTPFHQDVIDALFIGWIGLALGSMVFEYAYDRSERLRVWVERYF